MMYNLINFADAVLAREAVPVMRRVRTSQASLYVRCTWCGEVAPLEIMDKDGASYTCSKCGRSLRVRMLED